MKVQEYLNDITVGQYHIFDSHQEAMDERGVTHADQDYIVYSYNIHKNNKPHAGDAFLYRRPGKSSPSRKFYIYGGGIIADISKMLKEGDTMTYKRYKSEMALSKPEKVTLMSEYIKYYECLVNEQGLDALNVKIPRDVFVDILDEIGGVLNQKAIEMSCEDGPVKEFLEANPLPPHMKEFLPDDFRVFSLLLNALKQWVSAESQSTDRYLLGGTARATCREAVNKCIVTGGELGENPELHHPLRDGRPPILLSKQGHNFVEQNNQTNSAIKFDDSDNDVWSIVKQIRSKKNQSWVQLKEGCNAIITGIYNCRPGAKSFANVVIRDTGLSASDILEMLENKGL